MQNNQTKKTYLIRSVTLTLLVSIFSSFDTCILVLFVRLVGFTTSGVCVVLGNFFLYYLYIDGMFFRILIHIVDASISGQSTQSRLIQGKAEMEVKSMLQVRAEKYALKKLRIFWRTQWICTVLFLKNCFLACLFWTVKTSCCLLWVKLVPLYKIGGASKS